MTIKRDHSMIDCPNVKWLVENLGQKAAAAELGKTPSGVGRWVSTGQAPYTAERLATLLRRDMEDRDRKSMLVMCRVPRSKKDALFAVLKGLEIRHIQLEDT